MALAHAKRHARVLAHLAQGVVALDVDRLFQPDQVDVFQGVGGLDRAGHVKASVRVDQQLEL